MRRGALRARRLFAQALDTPGGLKVQTIHAFCTRLLHQFPFEADVAARFEVLEERTQSELIDRLRMAVLLEAAAEPDSDLGRALAIAITAAADMTFNEMIVEAIARRDELIAWISERRRRRGGDRRSLSRALGIDPERNVARPIDDGVLRRLADRAERISGRDRSAGAGLEGRQGACGALRLAAAARGQRADQGLSVDLLHGRARAAQEHRHARASASSNPRLFQRLHRRTGARVRADRAPPRGRDARAHRRAGHDRARRSSRAIAPRRTAAACSTTTT